MYRKKTLIILLFILLLFLQYNFKDRQIKIEYTMNPPSSSIGEITKGKVIQYEFTSSIENMDSIGIQFATYNRKNKGNVLVQLYDRDNSLIKSEMVNSSNLKDGSYKMVSFSKIKDSAGKNYVLKISGVDTEVNSAPTIFTSQSFSNVKTFIDGKQINENIKVESNHKFISPNRLIVFVILDLILLLYIFVLFSFGKEKVNDYIFKLRYPILFFLFVIGVSMKINFSSIPIWDNYIQSSKLNIYEENLIAGIPRSIRSDEWLVQTPMYLSQNLNDNKFPVFNEKLSTNGTNMILSAYAPVRDIISIGKPFNWGFLLLGKDYGFSWYWLSKVFLLFIFSFEMSMILTNNNRRISLFGAFIILFSSSIQWWLSTGVVDLLVFSQIIIVCLSWYMKSTNILSKVLCSLGIIIGGAGFIFNLYPPLQLPLGVMTLIFIFYILTENKNYKKLKPIDFLFILFILCALAGLVLHFYKMSAAQINLIQNTSYPGKRIAVGGGTKVQNMLYYLFSWILPFRDVNTFSNNSEASSFFTLFPVIPFIFVFIDKAILKKARLLTYLIYFSLLQLVWFFVRFPEWFTKLTFLSYAEPNRVMIVFGITSVYIIIMLIGNLEDIVFRIPAIVLFFLTNAFLAMALFRSDIQHFLGKRLLIFTLVYLNLTIFFIFKKNKKLSILLISVFVSVSGVFVNPVSTGLGPIDNKAISSEIKKIDSEHNGTWVGVGSSTFGNFLAANGVKAFNCVNYYPDFAKWSKIDPKETYKNIYNRYAHIDVKLTESNTSFVLNAADNFTVILNSNDLITKTNIDYIMTKNSIDSLNKNGSFKELYHDKIGDLYIYKVQR